MWPCCCRAMPIMEQAAAYMGEVTMTELVVKGDWACADRDGVSLCNTCRQLALLRPDVANTAEEIATIALRDVGEATRRWARLARELCGAAPRRPW